MIKTSTCTDKALSKLMFGRKWEQISAKGTKKKGKSVDNLFIHSSNLILLKLMTTAGACVESSLPFIRRSHLKLGRFRYINFEY
jgi:hypothetical protein